MAQALGAPVTIEDVELNVLAFSDHRGVEDPSRTASILGRRVPDHEVQLLRSEGVLTRLYSRDSTEFVPPRPRHALGRAAHRIRGDEQTFGAIWVATATELTPGQRRELREWSQVAARCFLRKRLDADDRLRDQSDRLARILAGDSRGTGLEALATAGGICVLAVAPSDAHRHHEAAALELQRLSASLRLHLSAVHPSCVVAPVDGVVYAVLPAGGAESGRARAVATARKFAESVASGRGAVDLTIAVAGPVDVCSGLPSARADADAVLRMLDGQPGQPGQPGQVVHAEDVQMRVLMMELRDLVDERGLRLVGPVMRLAAQDAAAGSDLVRHPRGVARLVRRRQRDGRCGARPPEHGPLSAAPDERGGWARPPMCRGTLRGHAADQASPRPRFTRPGVTVPRAW